MPNTVYDNFVLENKLESILATKVDLSNYMTVDRSLAEAAGMKKTVHKYRATGAVEDLSMGEGNSQTITASFASKDYEVGVTQGKAEYYDEEAMKDPMIVDTLVAGAAEIMRNDFTTKAINEMSLFELAIEVDFTSSSVGYLFDKVADALALFGEDEDGEGITMLVSPKNKAWIRKQLKDDLKYSEGFVRTGYIGHVCGVPVVVSNAVPDKCMFIEKKSAVTLFIKKGVESEQERDAGHRKNTMFLRKVALVALTDANKIIGLAAAQSTACAITTYTKNAKTIAGTCGTDCHLVRVVDGDGEVYDVTPSSGAWTMTAKANLTAGDKINATAFAPGKAPKAATEVTVAS